MGYLSADNIMNVQFEHYRRQKWRGYREHHKQSADVKSGRRERHCRLRCKMPRHLTPFELAALAIPGNSGFTLRCVLIADDPGELSDEVLFTFPLSRIFNNPLNLINADNVFTTTASIDLLNEDTNGADEIRARFTLINNLTGQRVIRRSRQVQIVL